ncbi:cytochrome p450 domain-containing protein [Phthorimaea operculella]|nr:cytochrome p450 domain-containing protein [Phthorimaea operculella]
MKSYPILGISYIFFGNNEVHMKAIQRVGRICNERNGITSGWFGPRFYLMVSDPVLAEIFLRNFLEKDQLYDHIRDMIGNGSFIAPVSIWRHRRKNMMPLFAPKSLNGIVPVFIRNSGILAERLKSMAGAKAFRMWDYLTSCNIDSICESVLEIRLNTQRNPDEPFLKASNEGLKLMSQKVTQPWLHVDWLYRCLPHSRRLKKQADTLFHYVDKIIKLKRSEVQSNEKNLKCFLEQMIENAGYNDVELLEESLVLILAATDTTAISVGFTMLMLARHAQTQEKVYEELQEVFGDSDRPLVPEDLQSLKYLDIVIKESIRLYPPSVTVLRRATKDLELPTGETVLEGCGIMVNIWAVHRNPEYWGADADEFRPERFLEPLKHPAQYMPFSVGPRNCPGRE